MGVVGGMGRLERRHLNTLSNVNAPGNALVTRLVPSPPFSGLLHNLLELMPPLRSSFPPHTGPYFPPLPAKHLIITKQTMGGLAILQTLATLTAVTLNVCPIFDEIPGTCVGLARGGCVVVGWLWGQDGRKRPGP